jgi:hypothetical protein
LIKAFEGATDQSLLQRIKLSIRIDQPSLNSAAIFEADIFSVYPEKPKKIFSSAPG